MATENIQYYKDRLKNSVYKRFSGVDRKLKTDMQSILLQLELKKMLPAKIDAIEMFGMHGLWHTMDYISYINSLDIFEINKKYHELSKKKLKKYNVKFYMDDSIKFIQETKNKYNFIVADIPFSGPFYDEHGLPLFFDDMVRIASNNSVIILNLHSDKLHNYEMLSKILHDKCNSRKVKDLFFMPKNRLVGYVVIVIE